MKNNAMKHYHKLSKLYASPHYKRIVRFLNNETLDQAIFTLNPDFINKATGCLALENKCVEMVRLMD